MKKIFAFLMTAILAVCVLTGCGGAASDSSSASESSSASGSDSQAQNVSKDANAYNLNDIVAAVEQVNPVANPRDVDNNFIQLDLLIDENIAEYAGKISNNDDNSALILAIKAEEGKGGEVKKALEDYKASFSSNKMYQGDFANKLAQAENARIVTKGDYLVFVIANTEGADYAEIDKALDEALK